MMAIGWTLASIPRRKPAERGRITGISGAATHTTTPSPGTGGTACFEGDDLARIDSSRVPPVRMPAIDLYWLPLGAGGHSVRLNGLRLRGDRRAPPASRPRRPLPLRARGRCARGAIRDRAGAGWGTTGERGVVAEGPVGIRWAGRFRIFRYEVRRWRDGVIPDVAEAVASPQR